MRLFAAHPACHPGSRREEILKLVLVLHRELDRRILQHLDDLDLEFLDLANCALRWFLVCKFMFFCHFDHLSGYSIIRSIISVLVAHPHITIDIEWRFCEHRLKSTKS